VYLAHFTQLDQCRVIEVDCIHRGAEPRYIEIRSREDGRQWMVNKGDIFSTSEEAQAHVDVYLKRRKEQQVREAFETLQKLAPELLSTNKKGK
jgi:hypothetical protein